MPRIQPYSQDRAVVAAAALSGVGTTTYAIDIGPSVRGTLIVNVSAIGGVAPVVTVTLRQGTTDANANAYTPLDGAFSTWVGVTGSKSRRWDAYGSKLYVDVALAGTNPTATVSIDSHERGV